MRLRNLPCQDTKNLEIKTDQKNVTKIITDLSLFAEQIPDLNNFHNYWQTYRQTRCNPDVRRSLTAVSVQQCQTVCNFVQQESYTNVQSTICRFVPLFPTLFDSRSMTWLSVIFLGFQLCSCLQHGSRQSLRVICPCSFPFHSSKQGNEQLSLSNLRQISFVEIFAQRGFLLGFLFLFKEVTDPQRSIESKRTLVCPCPTAITSGGGPAAAKGLLASRTKSN